MSDHQLGHSQAVEQLPSDSWKSVLRNSTAKRHAELKKDFVNDGQCGCARTDDGECGCIEDIALRKTGQQRTEEVG